MKWLLAMIAPMTLGFVLGHTTSRRQADLPEQSGQEQPVITFLGDQKQAALRTFENIPPG